MGSAPVPVAVSGGAQLPLKIAQPFMAGTHGRQFPKVPSRDERCLHTATLLFCRPSRDFFIWLTPAPAMNGWAIIIASLRTPCPQPLISPR